jgi:hypothetical protein
MPSHMPSSFASAAAGQASSRDSRSGRGDGRSGDWYVASFSSLNSLQPYISLPHCSSPPSLICTSCLVLRHMNLSYALYFTAQFSVRQSKHHGQRRPRIHPARTTSSTRGFYKKKKGTNKKIRAQRETRAPNGTAVLRRSSTTPFSQAPTQRDPTLPTPGSETTGSIQQPIQNFDQSATFRISKNQMLDIFRAQQDSGSVKRDVSHLFEGNWDPGHSNGTNGRSGWGKSTDGRESHGPDVCWDEDGSVLPVGLEEMSEQEQAVGHLCIPSEMTLTVYSYSLATSIRL